MTNLKNISVLFLCCLFVLTGLQSQNTNYAVSNIPLELLEDAHTVVRNDVRKVKIPSTSKVVIHYKSVVTILNEKSRANVLTIYYDSFNKVSKIKGKIYDNRGVPVRELNRTEFKDYSAFDGVSIYNDRRVKAVEVSHSDYPYTVEYEYKITYQKFMYYPDWFIQGYGVAVQNKELIVDVFDAKQLSFKAINTDLEPTIKEDGSSTIYHWQAKNKAAIKRVAMNPPREKVLPAVLLTPQKFSLGKYKGDTYNWSSYGTFMHQLNEGRDELPETMKAQVKALTSNAKTDQEKIDILYKYLQENTRYISVQLGIGGWQTFDAEYVDKNKYGDCKALTNYMKSMLKEAGITAYPVLIGSGRSDALITNDFVYPSFNHVILNVPSEDCWLECTSSYNPPNYIGSRNENRMAFRYTEEGGELVKTPDYKAAFNQEKNTATFKISPTGDAELTNQVLFTGTQQENYRYYKHNKSKEELEEWFAEKESFPSYVTNKFELKVSEEKPEVTLDYSFNIRKYASKGGKRIFVPLNIINALTYVPPIVEDRKVPIYISSDFQDEDEITFILPESYEVESIPEPSFTLESDFGSYSVDIKKEGNKVIYTRKLKITPGEYPAERYNEMRDFRKEVATRDAVKMVLIKKRT